MIYLFLLCFYGKAYCPTVIYLYIYCVENGQVAYILSGSSLSSAASGFSDDYFAAQVHKHTYMYLKPLKVHFSRTHTTTVVYARFIATYAWSGKLIRTRHFYAKMFYVQRVPIVWASRLVLNKLVHTARLVSNYINISY